MPESTSLRWSAYEHANEERGREWYIALGVAAVCIAGVSILFGNVLFAVLILVAATTLALIARHPPILVAFEISDRGVKVGETLHRYEDIISFWVEDQETDSPLLLIDTVKFMSPNLIIPLEHVSPAEVRAYLSERADEVPMKEPFAHKVLALLGI